MLPWQCPQIPYHFNFDGILGLGIKNLAVQDGFSVLDVLSGSPRILTSHFRVYLTDRDEPSGATVLACIFLNVDAWIDLLRYIEHGLFCFKV